MNRVDFKNIIHAEELKAKMHLQNIKYLFAVAQDVFLREQIM